MKSDSEIQKDVIAELHWEPTVNAAEIGVEVQDGIVTLAGHVPITRVSGTQSVLPSASTAL